MTKVPRLSAFLSLPAPHQLYEQLLKFGHKKMLRREGTAFFFTEGMVNKCMGYFLASLTVMAQEAEALPREAVAVTLAVPALMPLTVPLLSTVATFGSLLCQRMVTPLTFFPLMVAFSVSLLPTSMVLAVASRVTVILSGLTGLSLSLQPVAPTAGGGADRRGDTPAAARGDQE